MRASRGRRATRGLASFVVVVLLASACVSGGGSSTAPSSSADATIPSPVASTAPSATPSSATPSPQAESDRLRQALASVSPWQAQAAMHGVIGDAVATVSGTFSARGDDAQLTLMTTAHDWSSTVAQIFVGGRSWL